MDPIHFFGTAPNTVAGTLYGGKRESRELAWTTQQERWTTKGAAPSGQGAGVYRIGTGSTLRLTPRPRSIASYKEWLVIFFYFFCDDF